jgi:hypothetical protein
MILADEKLMAKVEDGKLIRPILGLTVPWPITGTSHLECVKKLNLRVFLVIGEHLMWQRMGAVRFFSRKNMMCGE